MDRSRSGLGGLLVVALMACGDGGGASPVERGPGRVGSGKGGDDGTRADAGSGATRASSLEGVWVATRDPAQLVRFAPGATTPAETVALEDTPLFVEIVDGVAFYINNTICLSDADFCSTVHYHELLTGNTGDIRMAGQTATGAMTYADGSLWVADGATDALWRINPSSKELVGGIKLGLHDSDLNDSLDVAASGDNVFVASFFSHEAAARVNTATHALEALGGEGDGTSGIAASRDAVWVTSRFDGTLRRLNAETLEVAESIDLEADLSVQVRNVAVAGSDVWVVAGAGGNAQTICCETAQPGLFHVSAEESRLVSYLPLDAPRGLRAHDGELWVMTEAAALQIDTAANTVARTLTPPHGTVTDVVIPMTGGGTGTTQGLGEIDPYSVVEPPPNVCKEIPYFATKGDKPVLGSGSASLTRSGATTPFSAGTCQIIRDQSGKALQYLAVFANGVPGVEETLVVTVDAYTGDDTYSLGSVAWSLEGDSSTQSGPVTISQTGLHGLANLEGVSVSFDCGAGDSVGAASTTPQLAGAGEALVEDTRTGAVYRFINVACERELLGGDLQVRTPSVLTEHRFHGFWLDSNDAAAAGSLGASLSFSFFGRGSIGLTTADVTLACGATPSGSFESEDGRYKGTFDCGI